MSSPALKPIGALRPDPGDRLQAARRGFGGQRVNPGVAGVGPKTAAKWLQQYGTLDGNLIAHADEAPGGPKTRPGAPRDAIANGNLAKSKRPRHARQEHAAEVRLGGLEAPRLGRSEVARTVPRVRVPRVRGARPQDALHEWREEERRSTRHRGPRAHRRRLHPRVVATEKRFRRQRLPQRARGTKCLRKTARRRARRRPRERNLHRASSTT